MTVRGIDDIIERGTAWATRADHADAAIFPGVMAAGGLCLVAAEPKAGKSWLLFGAALSVANGLPLLGQHAIERPGPVLAILTEGSHGASAGRFKSLALGYGLDPERALESIDVIWRRGVMVTDPQFAAGLAKRAADYSLIIFDVARDTWTGDENRADEVGRWLRPLRPVMDAGATVAASLHLSKPTEYQRQPGQRIRGSSAFYAAADSLIYLARTDRSGRDVRVSFESRDDAPAGPMLMTLPAGRVDGSQPVTLDYRPADSGPAAAAGRLADDILERVQQSPGLTKSALARLVSGRRADVLAAIEVMVVDGRIYADGSRSGNHRGLFPGPVPATRELFGNHRYQPNVETGSLPSIKEGTGTTVGNHTVGARA